MAKITINENIIYRVPQLPINADIKENWNQLKESIRISSPAFYAEIKDIESREIESLPIKKQFTIRKYFNRAKYRATPYGTFSSVGIFSNREVNKGQPITLERDQAISQFTDWPLKDQFRFDYADLKERNALLQINSSCYFVNGNLRYVYWAEKSFELSDIASHEIIFKVLNACKAPIRLHALKEELADLFADEADFAHTIIGMIGLQLIFCELQPNIIGEDYFNRVHFHPKDESGYIIAQRGYQSGGINKSLFQHLAGLCSLLQNIPLKKEDSPLERFIRRFQKRYDQQAVPIMEALDPETGIGYEDMEQMYDPNGFIQDFVRARKEEVTNGLKMFIAGGLPLKGDAEKTAIRLENWKAPQIREPMNLPNSFSALVSVGGNRVQLESMGGCTANALAGRFTIADEQIHRHCRQGAKEEQAANPDVLFFDIAYISEPKVDNVNRRKTIYDYQLTIGNFDTSEDPLLLTDLLLFVRSNIFMIWNKKLGKRMIPRLASAYNYTRSDLPVFRLLCDLQHQGLISQLSIQLRNLMPAFSFYPRLQYHNIILSPAAWKLEWQAVENSGLDLKNYLQHIGATGYVRTGAGDQTLCFNTGSDDDLILLHHLLEKEKTLYVEETIAPQCQQVQDETGNSYAAQLLLTLQHHEKVYENHKPVIVEEPLCYMPGSEWLYIEVYTYPRQFDRLLVHYIHPWVDDWRPLLKTWFFIRYNEGGDHIRVRLKVSQKKNAPHLLESLTSKMKLEVNNGIISDIQVKTYYPEWERYGVATMTAVEEHFSTDSDYVLELIQAGLSDTEKYYLCIGQLKEVKESGALSANEYSNWLHRTNKSWEREHQLSAPDFKKLNQQYKTFQPVEIVTLGEITLCSQRSFLYSLISILQKTIPELRPKMLGDLVHMHVNRLFSQHQRVHEMIIYYFLEKEIVQAKRLTSMAGL